MARRSKAEKKANVILNIIAGIVIFGFPTLALLFGTTPEEEEMEKVRQASLQRDVLLLKAKNALNQKRYQDALNFVDRAMDTFINYYEDQDFKVSILEEVKGVGISKYNEDDFENALQYLDIYRLNNESTLITLDLILKVIHAQNELGQVTASIDMLNFYILARPNDILFKEKLAATYRDYANDLEKSRETYDALLTSCYKDYRNAYGSSYALSINMSDVPNEHYTIFCGSALTHIMMGQISEAKKNFKWANKLRPNQAMYYHVIGVMNWKQENIQSACSNWDIALEKGYDQSKKWQSQYCN